MPWTNKKFPESMKKLTAEVRNKAISIGNALLKENKKMKEGIAIATAIKNAKAFVAKKTKKKSPLKKQVKATVKKKIKVIYFSFFTPPPQILPCSPLCHHPILLTSVL